MKAVPGHAGAARPDRACFSETRAIGARGLSRKAAGFWSGKFDAIAKPNRFISETWHVRITSDTQAM
ncbi:MAG: hypothetical protein V4801_38065 [Burkholderia gladioli]